MLRFVLMIAVSAWLAAPAFAQGYGEARVQLAQSGGGSKLCSIFVRGDWRDTINVPFEWRPRACALFAREAGARGFQVGCLFRDGDVSFGGFTSADATRPAEFGGFPSRNCGWRFGPQ